MTWLAILAIGIGGYILYRGRHILTGLILLAVYAALGLDGMLHYGRAPLTDHTAGMNATIWFEVVTAAIALGAVIWLAANRLILRATGARTKA